MAICHALPGVRFRAARQCWRRVRRGGAPFRSARSVRVTGGAHELVTGTAAVSGTLAAGPLEPGRAVQTQVDVCQPRSGEGRGGRRDGVAAPRAGSLGAPGRECRRPLPLREPSEWLVSSAFHLEA